MVDKQGMGSKEMKGRIKKGKKLSGQTLLYRFLGSGLIGLIAGLMIGVLINKLNLPIGWHLITVGISGFGLVMLVSAWFIRQGLVHGRLMKLLIRLMHLI